MIRSCVYLVYRIRINLTTPEFKKIIIARRNELGTALRFVGRHQICLICSRTALFIYLAYLFICGHGRLLMQPLCFMFIHLINYLFICDADILPWLSLVHGQSRNLQQFRLLFHGGGTPVWVCPWCQPGCIIQLCNN